MKGKSNSKGITLIALVVTIIILIILAGVSISLLFGENGIITKAKEGASAYDKAGVKEKLELEKVEAAMNSNMSLTLDQYLNHIKAKNIITDGDIDRTSQISANIVVDSKYVFSLVEDNGDIKIEYEGDAGNLTLGVTAQGHEGEYDGQSHSITVISQNATITYSEQENGTYTSANPSYSAIGEYTVYYKVERTGYSTITGSKQVKITAIDISKCEVTLESTSYEHTGEAITPLPTVKNGATTLTANTDYTVSYSNNTNEGTATVTVTGKGNYTGTKTANFDIVVTKRTTLQVGDTVSYNPSGTYNWDASYATSHETGSTDYTNANQTLSSASGQSFNISSWKVLSINGTTVEMVPTAETTGTVTLFGAQGYNNAVKLLNDACSSLYSNSSKGITARSIKIEDIEKIITSNGFNPAGYSNGDVSYGSQYTSAYTSCKYYPTIYEQEKNSVINGSKKTSGLGLSEQTSLILRTASSATNGYLQASTSIQPYQTYYFLYSLGYLGTTYKDIILPRGTSTTYWVASRCVTSYLDHCKFCVSCVYSGYLECEYLLISNRATNTHDSSFALFPVVSLSSSVISGNEVDGFRVN